MSGLIFTKKETDQTVSYTSFFSFISIVSHELQLIQDKIIILQVKILFGDQEDIIISSPVLRNIEEGPDLAMIVKSLLHIIADRVEVDLKKPGEFVIMRDRPAELTAEVLHAGAFRLLKLLLKDRHDPGESFKTTVLYRVFDQTAKLRFKPAGDKLPCNFCSLQKRIDIVRIM